MGAAHVMFVAHDAGGTIPPVLAVAQTLVDAGHRATVLSQPSAVARAEAIGCTAKTFAGIGDYAPDQRIEDQLETALPLLIGEGVGHQTIELADAANVDVIVVDPNLAGAMAAAEAGDRPSAVLLHSLYATFVDVWFGELWGLLGTPINEMRGRFELGPRQSWDGLFGGHDLVVSPVPIAFNPRPPASAAPVEHVGFLVPRADETHGVALADRPTVLVSLSTTYQSQTDQLGGILRAIGQLSVNAIVTASPAVSAAVALEVPANVSIVPFVRHSVLLPSVHIVVTHGGLGTVSAALAHGVPLVCQPISRDQPLNAQRVAELGAGLTIDADASPAAIVDHIRPRRPRLPKKRDCSCHCEPRRRGGRRSRRSRFETGAISAGMSGSTVAVGER